jgi:hypothetical protein
MCSGRSGGRYSIDMLTRPAVLALIAVSSANALLVGQSPYRLGSNVQVTHASDGQAAKETYLCADPRSSRRLLAASIVFHGDTLTNWFLVSIDGGASWLRTLAVPASVDPSCAITSAGVVFAASVHDSAPSGDSYLNVHRSLDGGRSWMESTIHDNTRNLDRAYITEGLGRVFVHAYAPPSHAGSGPGGEKQAVALLYASRDSGRTFDRVATLPGTSFENSWFFPANGVFTRTGAFIGLLVELDNAQNNMFRGRSDTASAPHAPNGELRVMRSMPGEVVTTQAIGDVYYDRRVPQLSMSSLAVDRSSGPCSGRLYAVWPDARYGRRSQILLARSDDEGQTWSGPRVVSDGPDSAAFGPNNFMPMVAVNAAGVVAVSWYDRRDNPDSLSYWPRFRASLDCGASWLASVRVSSAPNRLKPSDRHLNGGDTAGLAADNEGRFHVIWIDNRTGTAQAWTSTVEVRGEVRAPRLR